MGCLRANLEKRHADKIMLKSGVIISSGMLVWLVARGLLKWIGMAKRVMSAEMKGTRRGLVFEFVVSCLRQWLSKLSASVGWVGRALGQGCGGLIGHQACGSR